MPQPPPPPPLRCSLAVEGADARCLGGPSAASHGRCLAPSPGQEALAPPLPPPPAVPAERHHSGGPQAERASSGHAMPQPIHEGLSPTRNFAAPPTPRRPPASPSWAPAAPRRPSSPPSPSRNRFSQLQVKVDAFDLATSEGWQPHNVLLHIYHCDVVTSLLNKTVLLQAEIPIYHVGVEVYGREWTFQYFENAWSEAQITGVRGFLPMQAPGYEYVKTVSMGPTPLSEGEALGIVSCLRQTWQACTYHITRRNCVTFAEILCRELQVLEPFPAWLKAILEASSNPTADSIIDYSWSWSKWLMIRRQQQQADARAHDSWPPAWLEASFANFWAFSPTSMCVSLVKASGQETPHTISIAPAPVDPCVQAL